ncbi:MAG: DegV family protein [Bacteroidales bacterium]
MSNRPVFEIDGRFLYYAFLAGGNKILENQSEINRINVFPVNDKDTGTNLASTVRSVLDNIRPHKSYKTTVENIAEAALIGARGNSGVIFAQFLYGMSRETRNTPVVTFAEFAASIKRSIPYMYEAISNPVEGTMLTVIKEWSDFISDERHTINDFKKIIIESLEVLKQSLMETKTKLKVLAQSNFVDAGAKGFVLFIEGIIDFIQSRNIRQLVVQQPELVSLIHTEEMVDDKINFRYCTEAILRNCSVDKPVLKDFLSQNGDSVVVAGSNSLCRLHVHSNEPAELFYKLKNYGTITFQKVDDMVRQHETATQRKWNIAIVTDSTCDLSDELLDFYQINVVPLNLNFGENHFLDKVTIKPEQFYEMLESSNEFPKTSQINERAFTNVYSHLASHYDAVISLHVSSHFSGTYLSSVRAGARIASEFNKPVVVIDSKTLSGSLGLVVLRVAQAIESGWSLEKITNATDQWKKDAKIFVSVKDLKYMIKGGRVSKNKGFVANLLGVNPIVSVTENGKSILFGQAFSQKGNINKVMKHVTKISKNRSIWNYIVLHAHNESGAAIYTEWMVKLTGKQPISVVNISPVIGMNAGIGTIAVSLMFE